MNCHLQNSSCPQKERGCVAPTYLENRKLESPRWVDIWAVVWRCRGGETRKDDTKEAENLREKSGLFLYYIASARTVSRNIWCSPRTAGRGHAAAII